MLFTMQRFLFIATVFINTVNREERREGGDWNRNRAQQNSSSPLAHRTSHCSLPLRFLLCLLHSPLFTLHKNSGEQLTTGLRRFYHQPLLFLFLFSFIFCILHCSKKKNRNRAQWRAAPSAHHWPPLFPPPTIVLLFPFSFVFCSGEPKCPMSGSNPVK